MLGETGGAATATGRGSRLSDEGGVRGRRQQPAVPTTLCKKENKGALLGGIIRLSGWVQDQLSKPLGT